MAVLNPTASLTNASLVMVLNPTVLIPTPLLFSTGIIVGEYALLNPVGFL